MVISETRSIRAVSFTVRKGEELGDRLFMRARYPSTVAGAVTLGVTQV
jgi:hypothetical protein